MVRGQGCLVGVLLLALASLACVQVDLSPQPVALAVVAPAPTAGPTSEPLVWPTLSPRPAPLKFRVANTGAAPPQFQCQFPDLPSGEHVSSDGNYEIIESLSVGRMECHIQRDSCTYNRLVGKLDPAIIYKKEETAPYDGEDLLVHPAIVQPLTRLNQLVQAEWRGAVKLRVTDAYDSLLSHDPAGSEPAQRYSLHYEGRAIDFTTSPVDRSLYPRLCALAVCAGFDWVHNETTHCHASVRASSLCQQCSN